MIGRLVYEVRLKPLKKEYRSKIHKKWRWDVTYYKTADGRYPGVEDCRCHLGGICGYERFKWQALLKIGHNIVNNKYKKRYPET